jgi:hypothetical protein
MGWQRPVPLTYMRLASTLLLLGACGAEEGGKPTGSDGSSGSSHSSDAGTSHQTNGGSGGNGSAGSASGGKATTMAGSSPGGAASGNQGGSSSVQSGAITCRTKGDGKSTISFVNKCQGTLSFRGTDIEGGDLAPGEHACRDVGDTATEIPAIRFWGFIGTDPGGEKYTLAELTLNTSFNDFDWYNISHVDASNLPMQVVPVDMASCRTLICAESLLANCPAVGVLKDANGKVISCVSPDRDNRDSEVARYFEASCKDAYSWSGDDSESVAACAGEDYDVVFCP